MSYNVWPTFAGKGWDIKKRPITSTIIQAADSGAEYRTQRYQYPLYEFDIEIPYLSLADAQTLEGFFMGQGGPATPFYLSADNDNAVTAQGFGATDGTTTQFQLSKSSGAYWSEPVAGINGSPSIFADGVQIFSTGTGTPAAPTLGQVAGGSKGARTYYVRILYVDAAGNNSLPTTEQSIAVSAGNLLTIPSPIAAPGAVYWQIFISTTSGAEQLAASLLIGADYTEPTGTLPAAGICNTADQTTCSISPSGVLTLAHHGLSGHALTWTGNYYYLVRFKEDSLETTQFMSAMYEATTITLRAVR